VVAACGRRLGASVSIGSIAPVGLSALARAAWSSPPESEAPGAATMPSPEPSKSIDSSGSSSEVIHGTSRSPSSARMKSASAVVDVCIPALAAKRSSAARISSAVW
jgi:hypothetical protein